LALYIISSVFFVLLSAFWYYEAQVSAFKSNDYYQLQHKADTLSREIITSFMQGKPLPFIALSKHEGISLFNTQGEFVSGYLLKTFTPTKETYFIKNEISTLVSEAPQSHHNIKYVVVQSMKLSANLTALKLVVSGVVFISIVLLILLAWILSKIFLRPISQKVQQIETFIQDISHELNTPITALKMSAQRAKQKGIYDEKIITNISISTKQLYDIYTSLTFLNFSHTQEVPYKLNLKPLLQESIAYYNELSKAKNITITQILDDASITILPERAKLLFSNLIANAIKYSMPDTTIAIVLKTNSFSIRDEGVGIATDALEEIFKPYSRSSQLAGGFGVGLSIVKQICDTYSIAIAVDSKRNKGTTFSLEWEALS